MTKSTVMYWNPLVPDSLLDLTIASKMQKHYMNRSWNTCQYAKTATLQAIVFRAGIRSKPIWLTEPPGNGLAQPGQRIAAFR